MSIDHDAEEFPYAQLAAILRAAITRGDYPPGRRIPSLERLRQEHGLSTMTIRKAVKVLEDEGLVSIVPGRGTFVTRR